MDVEAVFQELDQAVAQVTPRLGLACAPGCGACCRRPTRQIEASAAELAPLARHLWTTGQAQAVLEAARTAGAEGWCALYQPGPDSPYPQGRCGAYAHHPLTCRPAPRTETTEGGFNTVGSASRCSTTPRPRADFAESAEGCSWVSASQASWRQGVRPLGGDPLTPLWGGESEAMVAAHFEKACGSDLEALGVDVDLANIDAETFLLDVAPFDIDAEAFSLDFEVGDNQIEVPDIDAEVRNIELVPLTYPPPGRNLDEVGWTSPRGLRGRDGNTLGPHAKPPRRKGRLPEDLARSSRRPRRRL